ncbi:hypothetical protein F4553_002289 [Allocatelliglobosispora scoriae]|uniref:Uncharacterized protein n=1 Tax=Allocatelliglobosispora scoriae TaxID=643052 RepID=A0A841BQ08_9ACTN|nr:hypothetical protein [Allocatelliglobosispora scoriae]MBB5868910.1 hypothetical protein [Allocatelliglobosispora scoriae]
MTRLRGGLIAVACSLILLSAGCAQGKAADDAGDGGPSLLADAVALRVSYTGGFVGADALVSRLPMLTIYGDGRVITEGPQIAIYPGPALPNIQVQRISTVDVETLINRALAAGVGTTLDYGQPPIADAPSTRFTVHTSAGVKTAEANALGEATTGAGLTEAQVAARKKLQDLLAALTDLPKTLGADKVSKSDPYQPVTLAVITREWVADNGVPGEQKPIAWPGAALPGESMGLNLGCVTATGKELGRALDAAKGANTVTPWTSGGKSWTLTFRPLLPDETGCADLRRTS